jgi:membrane-associated phospholipid phosphatase
MKPLDPLFAAVAWPGESPRGHILPPATAGIVALLAGPRNGLWQLAAWGISPLSNAIKRIVDRPRPFPGRFDPMGGLSQDPSFPSSHVSEYVVCFGFASWLLRRRGSPAAGPATATSLMLITLIGPSRVRSGDHRWSDVVGGYLLGAAYLATLIAFAKRGRRPGAVLPTSKGIVLPDEAIARRRALVSPSRSALAADDLRVLADVDPLVGRLSHQAVAGPAREFGADHEVGPEPHRISGHPTR